MKNYSLPIKLVACGAIAVCGVLVYCTFGLMYSPSYGQGRILTKEQLDAIVTPKLSQCLPSSSRLQSGQLTSSRLDPASIIPTSNAREFPRERIARTLHGMWRGEVFGDYNKDLRVDYFWIIDTQRNEGLIIAQRTGNQSMPMRPVPNAPKMSYLMCAHDGYIPSSEVGAQIHQFTKVSNSIEDAPQVLEKATGLKFTKGQPTLSEMWEEIVASGYFQSLPAVAFAGALFKPMRIELVPSPVGPAQVSMSWDSEYYGGGATKLKFTPGVPMRGAEYTQFVGTSATKGDFLVASPGNGKLYKVEASNERAALTATPSASPSPSPSASPSPSPCQIAACYPGYYDLAFDSVTVGPLQ